jgi:hypothetical protein
VLSPASVLVYVFILGNLVHYIFAMPTVAGQPPPSDPNWLIILVLTAFSIGAIEWGIFVGPHPMCRSEELIRWGSPGDCDSPPGLFEGLYGAINGIVAVAGSALVSNFAALITAKPPTSLKGVVASQHDTFTTSVDHRRPGARIFHPWF